MLIVSFVKMLVGLIRTHKEEREKIKLLLLYVLYDIIIYNYS